MRGALRGRCWRRSPPTPDARLSRAAAAAATAERAQLLAGGTAPRATYPARRRACTSCSRRRRRARRTPPAVPVRGRGAHLRGAGRARQPARAAPARASAWGRRRRVAVCLERGAGAGRRAAGRAEGGRRLRPAGPRATRPSAWPSCCATPARRSCVSDAALRRRRSRSASADVAAARRRPRRATARRRAGAAAAAAVPDDLAYVIYTSGSTGTPKGGDGRARAARAHPACRRARPSASAPATWCRRSPRSPSTSRCWSWSRRCSPGGAVRVVPRERRAGPGGAGGRPARDVTRAARRPRADAAGGGGGARAGGRCPRCGSCWWAATRCRPTCWRTCARPSPARRRVVTVRAHRGDDHLRRRTPCRAEGAVAGRPIGRPLAERARCTCCDAARRAGPVGRARRAVDSGGAGWRAATWAGRS